MGKIGFRIRRARNTLSWSQARLAEAANVSQPTVANWENGSHSPREAALQRLSQALGVSRLWLQEGQHSNSNLDTNGHTHTPASYLATPIVHVPVLSWPVNAAAFDHEAATPIRYIAISLQARTPFALECDDLAVRRAFLPGSLIIFEGTNAPLIEGHFYLFDWRGNSVVRRWRDNPFRFEPAGDPGRFETLFPDEPPTILGHAIMSIQDLAH